MKMNEARCPAADDLQRKIGKCIEALRQNLPVHEIWLFGSCARGEVTPDSDIDLLTVLDDNHGLARPGLTATAAISRQHAKLRADVLVLTASQWRREMTSPFGIYADILSNGKKVYAR